MAQIAKVVAITGNVIAVGLDGQARFLKVGDVIERSETLRTFAGARAELQMADGQVLSIAPEQSMRVEDSLMQTDATPTAQEAAVQAATPAAVLQALQLENDPFFALEAPGSGPGVGDAGGGSSFVRLLRIVEGVEPLAYEYTLGPPPTIEDVPLSAEPVGADLITVRYIQLDDSGQPLRQNGGLVFLDGRDVVEGTRVGLYATVNTPPSGTDLVINLSNGQSITIPVGGGSGLVEVSVRPDDPYIQGREVIDIGVTGANGGGYDQLDVDQSTAITVVDDQDLTQVGIIGPDSVREGDITAPYTVTLERPGQTPVVVTFQYSGVAQNGVDFTGVASITIPAGQSSQTFTIQTLVDQLAEGSELYNIRIESITGGNFERFEVNPTASAVDTTIIDATQLTVNLVGDASVDEGATAGYTVSLAGGTLANDQQLSVQVATGPGQTLVPDATSGVDYNPLTQTLTFTTAAQGPVKLSVVTLDDALVEGSEEYTVNLSNVAGGSIGTGSVTTQIKDDDAPVVSIAVAPPSVAEDGAVNLTYQVSLDQVSVTDTVVTIALSGTATESADYAVTGLSAGATRQVTIAAGQLSVSFVVDPAVDSIDESNETVVATITAATGANISPTANVATGTIVDDDTIPRIEDAQSRVSEEGLPAGIPDGLGSSPGNDLTDSATDSSGNLPITRNGTAPLTIELVNPGSSVLGATNLTWAYGTSQSVLIGSDAGGEVIRVTLNGGTIDVGSSGASVPYSVVLSRPVSHLLQGQGTAGEDIASLNLTVRISDGVNPADESTITVTVEDDSPIITSVAAADSLTVDETNLAANATASFADNFSSAISYGADGPGTTGYSLALSGANVDSGLYALGVGGAAGAQIVLNQAGNVITGRVGGTDYFTITVNATTGDVTLDQLAAIYHGNPGNPDDSSALSAAAGALLLRATVTDADGDTATHALDLGAGVFNLKDDGPSISAASVAAADSLTVDETNLAANATASFADNFSSAISYGADGPGTTGYSLALSGANVDSGLYALGVGGAAGAQIVLNQAGNVITGRVGGTDYFTITVNATTGDVTLDQLAAIYHGNPGNPDDSSALSAAAGALLLRATVTDADGDTATHALDLGAGVFNLKDDGPSISAASVAAADSLTVDETNLAANATASFADNFSSAISYGADGPGTTGYSLALSGANVDSGLYALGVGGAAGAQIVLNQAGNVITGRVGGTDYFTITVNATTGDVTLDQLAAIYHGNPGNPDDSSALSAAAGALLLRATVTDADGDTATHALDLGAGVFNLKDDGPSIAVSSTAPAAALLQVDESLLGTDASFDFGIRFGSTSSYGADGAGTVSSAFALGIKSVGADSGLVDTATGNHIYLYLSGNDVVGRVGSATTTPNAAGAVAFRVSNSGASVTLDQVSAIVHPTTQPNEAKSLSAADLITLTRTDTITDRDGDTGTGSNSINLGNAISFLDDGPTTTLTVKNTIFIPLVNVDETVGPDRYAPSESPDAGNNDDGMGWLGRVTTSVSGGLGLANLFDLGGAYGADGAGSITPALSLTGIPPGGLATNLSSTAGGAITLFLEGGVIVGRDADGGNPVFRIEIVNTASSGNPAVYELQTTLYEAIRHGDPALHDESIDLLTTAGEVNLNYQVIRTDGDGDRNTINSSIVLIDSSSSFFSFDDDGPMTDPSTSGQAVDSLGYLSFGSDGGHVESIAVEGTTYTWNTGTDSIDVSGGPSSLLGFDASTHLLQVSVGTGQFTVDMDDGRYNLLLTPAADYHLDVDYQLIDNDGDRADGTLPIDLKVSQIGDSGGNVINGTAGSNDLLLGEDGNDILDGLSGDDLLVGGKDSDTMTGGAGADTFVWHRNDQGTGGSIDTITDFGTGLDRLDLRDLLQGEHQGAAAGTSGSLEQYLHFRTSGADTVIDVTVNGGNPWVVDPHSSDLSIVLQGVTLAGADDASKISNLLAANKLVVDL